MNEIHPTATLTGQVHLGHDNYIGPGAVISGPIDIGDGNFIGAHCVLGGSPHDDFISPLDHGAVDASRPHRYGGISIGNGNVFREFTSVHRGMTGETVVGSQCYLMAHSTISHDCCLRDHVKVGAGVQTGGYCRFGEGSYLGLSSSFHQFTVVGGYSIVGMGSVVVSHVLPGSKVYGVPARLRSFNRIALERLGIQDFGWWTEYSLNEAGTGVPEQLAATSRYFRTDVEACIADRRAASRFRQGGGSVA